MSWTVFPTVYTNLQSKACFQFCFQVRRPVISTILDPYMTSFEKWEIITDIFDSWKNQNVSNFYFWEKQPQKWTNFQLFTLYSKGRHFSITKLDILIFCNILHIEMNFLSLNSKRKVSSETFWQKPRKKQYKWDAEKDGIAYSTARNLKTTYLWNFHFH